MKFTPNGMAICNFAIAVNERQKKTGTDDFEDRPNFFDITVFGNYGKVMQQYLTKGREITVTGKLRQDRWSNNGQNYSRVSVIADNLELQRVPGANNASNGANLGADGGFGNADTAQNVQYDGDGEQIPF